MAAEQRRAPRGFSYDPCQGCGSTECRRKGLLCSTCRPLLEKARQAQAEQEAAGDVVLMQTPERACDLPYFNTHEESMSFDDPRHDAFRKAFHAIVVLTTKTHAVERWGAGGYERLIQDDSHSTHRNSYEVRAVPTALADALRRCYAEAMDMTKRAHAQGAKEGRNLLMSLASGDITSDKFNEAAARLDRAAP